MLRDHPYIMSAHFWTFSDTTTHPTLAQVVLKVSKNCHFSDPTHPVPLLTWCRDGPLRYVISSSIRLAGRKACYKTQSHYIEVTQGGDSSRAIHNWLWIFSLIWGKKKNQKKKKNFIKKILLFFFKIKNKILALKTWENCPQKIGPHFFFSIANRHKTSPNHIFCSLKMSPCANSI